MLQVESLCYSYRRNAVTLDGITLEGRPGECIAILGNNGCGKTTLIKLIDRILKATAGDVSIDGKSTGSMDRNALARSVAYVTQDNSPSQTTVYNTILLGRKPHIHMKPSARDYEVVESVIRRLQLEAYALRPTLELSGGEFQKVVIGRALAQEPRVLLLDEPTSSLDMRNQKEVLELVRAVAKTENLLALIVIHDINAALRYCDRFVFLRDHRVLAQGGREIITEELLGRVYGLPVRLQTFEGIPVVVPI